MPAGTFVKPDELEWRPWPQEGLTEAYLVKGKASEKDLAGAVVRTHLYAGEPITTSRVVHPGEQGFLAAVLDPGKRAVAIPVDGTSGVAGFVFPGDFVDVILTIKRTVTAEGSEGSETRQFSETLLTDVRVLAIDQTLDNDSGAREGRQERDPRGVAEAGRARRAGARHGHAVAEPAQPRPPGGGPDGDRRGSAAASTATPATPTAATRATPTCCS